MKVLFGDFKTHYKKYKTEIDQAVSRVLESGHFILGSELESFEKAFSSFHGGGYTIGCANGTEAIYLALAAGGVDIDDEVITVAHTAVPTISAISMTGARPVFVDIDSVNCLMDISQVESLITEKTKAIIPVHLYGQMVDMQSLLKISIKHKVPLIEDVAQATGARYKGAIAGSLGQYSAFSFYPSKNLGGFGDGGAVFTKEKEAYEKLVMLRNYGQSKRYHHDIIGINSRLDEIQAAILHCRLPYLEDWNKRRREIASRYTEGLKSLADYLKTPAINPDSQHVFHLYVIQVEERDALQNHLLEQGIQTLIHYPTPAHMQKAYEHLGYKKGSLPVTEHITQRILSLPMYPELTDEHVDLVIEKIISFFNTQNRLPLNENTQFIMPLNNMAHAH